MIGFGIMAGGFALINWSKLAAVVLSCVISPVFSLVIAYVMFKLLSKKEQSIDKKRVEVLCVYLLFHYL
jgi:phosphate/sulfate permease